MVFDIPVAFSRFLVHLLEVFSNYGSCIDFFAPGAGITGANNAGTSGAITASGTSVAAAIAAGVATLHLDEINPRNIKYSYSIDSIPAELKAKIDKRAYRNSVTNLGAGSPNVMIGNCHSLQGQSSLQTEQLLLF